MPPESLASLARQARKLTGKLMAQGRRLAEAKVAQSIVDALATDERAKALRTYLDSNAAAKSWKTWADKRMDERINRNVRALDALEIDGIFEPSPKDYCTKTVQARRAHARFLLDVAYGASEARAAALAAFDAEEPTEVSDDPERAAYLAKRRAAGKAAYEAAQSSAHESEPSCPLMERGAVAMLTLLSDPDMLSALPGTVRAHMMLPDALRRANMLLSQTAQASMTDATGV